MLVRFLNWIAAPIGVMVWLMTFLGEPSVRYEFTHDLGIFLGSVCAGIAFGKLEPFLRGFSSKFRKEEPTPRKG